MIHGLLLVTSKTYENEFIFGAIFHPHSIDSTVVVFQFSMGKQPSE